MTNLNTLTLDTVTSAELKKLGRLFSWKPSVDSIPKNDLIKILRKVGYVDRNPKVEAWSKTVKQSF